MPTLLDLDAELLEGLSDNDELIYRAYPAVQPVCRSMP